MWHSLALITRDATWVTAKATAYNSKTSVKTANPSMTYVKLNAGQCMADAMEYCLIND